MHDTYLQLQFLTMGGFVSFLGVDKTRSLIFINLIIINQIHWQSPAYDKKRSSSTASPTSPRRHDNKWIILHQVIILAINLRIYAYNRPTQDLTQPSLTGTSTNAAKPHFDPTLFEYRLSIVIISIRRSWYHTSICFIRNGHYRGKSYVLTPLLFHQTSHQSHPSQKVSTIGKAQERNCGWFKTKTRWQNRESWSQRKDISCSLKRWA